MVLMPTDHVMDLVNDVFREKPSAEAVKKNPPVANPAADRAAANEAQHLQAWAEVVAPVIANAVEQQLPLSSSIATKVTPAQQSVKQSNAKGKRWTEEEKEALLELAADAKERKMIDSARKRFIESEFAARGIKHTYDAAKQALLRLQKAPSVCKPRGAQTKPMKVSKCSACGEPRRGHICKKKQAQQLPLPPPPLPVMATPVAEDGLKSPPAAHCEAMPIPMNTQ
tara:strand:- start:174 stop:851 length:678 start_codon:yes stop_codon:yes gene_type:complete